jgi:hypothetical protein
MSTGKFLSVVNGIVTWFTAISSSAGVADANKIAMTGANGRFDNSLMPPGIGAATETIVASENLAAGDFVNIWSNAGTRNVRKADASNGRSADGFVLVSVTSGQSATVTLQGVNTALSGLTIGVNYFLSATTAGGVDTVAPSATGQSIQILGKSISATTINFERDMIINII